MILGFPGDLKRAERDRGSRAAIFALVPALVSLGRDTRLRHSTLMFAALMIGHHFSISALWCA
jgi:hypothetical protein